MNAIVKHETGALAHTQLQGRMAVAEIIAHVATVQEVMKAVMKPEVHYGKIPGTDKPTLLKAGAEVLCMVFRIADTYVVEDLSTDDVVRYRVTCRGEHQTSGVVLGSGLGEASSGEEKYKWRKAVCKEEWDETPAHLRRIKHARGKGGSTYKQDQVRTEPADLANTILKMANKRAKMAMVLNVTAASDCFSQDLEDMDEAMRDHLARHGEEGTGQDAGAPPPPPAAPETWPEESFQKRLPSLQKGVNSGKPAQELIAWMEAKGPLTEAQKKVIRDLKPEPVGDAATDVQVKGDAPTMTFAQVMEKMVAAKTKDELDAAATLIAAVADAGQREELGNEYDGFLAKLADQELPI